MNKFNFPLTSALIIVAFVLGLTIGYGLSNRTTTAMDSSMNLGVADRWVDLRYLNQMATHHQGAIELAKSAQRYSQRPEIRALAKSIEVGEPKLIAELVRWKKDWYNDRSGVAKPTVPNLGTADANFDLRFLNALIAHHEAGISMTKEIATKSSRNDVLTNASAVEDFLVNSLVTLKNYRQNWYGQK